MLLISSPLIVAHIVSLQLMTCCSSTDSWWRHQTERFSALLALCAGNSPVTGEFPEQMPVTQSLMFSLISAWINDWVNNRDAGNLRRSRTHYDVIWMLLILVIRQIFPLHLAISLTVKTVWCNSKVLVDVTKQTVLLRTIATRQTFTITIHLFRFLQYLKGLT